mgnify:CR=1 FL=1
MNPSTTTNSPWADSQVLILLWPSQDNMLCLPDQILCVFQEQEVRFNNRILNWVVPWECSDLLILVDCNTEQHLDENRSTKHSIIYLVLLQVEKPSDHSSIDRIVKFHLIKMCFEVRLKYLTVQIKTMIPIKIITKDKAPTSDSNHHPLTFKDRDHNFGNQMPSIFSQHFEGVHLWDPQQPIMLMRQIRIFQHYQS